MTSHIFTHFVLLLSLLCCCCGLYRWKNDEVEIIRTQRPRVGHHLVLAVKHRDEYSHGTCYFVSPSGSIEYHLENGQVVDGDGILVDDVDLWDDGDGALVDDV